MRKARELLRLCLDKGHSGRQAARSVGISASTASVYLRRAREAELDWATVATIDDAALERTLAGEPPAAPAKPARALPEVAHIKRELAKPDMTLGLLFEEYRREHPDGYQYSFFCELVRRELCGPTKMYKPSCRGRRKGLAFRLRSHARCWKVSSTLALTPGMLFLTHSAGAAQRLRLRPAWAVAGSA